MLGEHSRRFFLGYATTRAQYLFSYCGDVGLQLGESQTFVTTSPIPHMTGEVDIAVFANKTTTRSTVAMLF